jgi:ABC-type multidrug transport system fused ATPase/permease subunit
VLKQARIVESGTHDELMKNQALYSELFNLQASAYLED